jgi:hypothetical protein
MSEQQSTSQGPSGQQPQGDKISPKVLLIAMA